MKKSCTKDGLTWSNSIDLHCERLKLSRLMEIHSLNLYAVVMCLGICICWSSSLWWGTPQACYWCQKWSCPCICANPFCHDVPCLCMAPHFKFMVAIPDVEHLRQQLGKVQIPPQKLFEPIIILPPYKTPWASKLETIFSWNCQFVGVMKNTFLPPYTPLGLMSISSSRHQSWEHDELLAS